MTNFDPLEHLNRELIARDPDKATSLMLAELTGRINSLADEIVEQSGAVNEALGKLGELTDLYADMATKLSRLTTMVAIMARKTDVAYDDDYANWLKAD
jgi:hypothetical protein